MSDVKFETTERELLSVLDLAVHHPAMNSRFELSARSLDQRLDDEPDLLLAWETVPLAAYPLQLPPGIRSSWIFILRAGVETLPERHPNSHQRMVAYRGAGDFPVWDGAGWKSNLLVSDFGEPLERRWVSIPANTWHQSMKPAQNLVVVSFHTASEEELIEENGDPASSLVTHSRRYSEVMSNPTR